MLNVVKHLNRFCCATKMLYYVQHDSFLLFF